MPSATLAPKAAVPKFKFSEPRRNLKTYRGRATHEDLFTIGFAREYWNQFPSIHSGTRFDRLSLVREIPVNGFGIADLLAVAWEAENAACDDIEAFAGSQPHTVRAFEMKLANWRAAMSQATRYKSFAHQAIVVLPPEEGRKAIDYLPTFKTIRVGLWIFDHKTSTIRALHTPRSIKPRSHRYHVEALIKASTTASPALPIA